MQKNIIILLSILLSACSGSSDNAGTDDLLPGTAGIAGDVVDAISGAPIPSVEISVDGLPQTSLSDSSGEYQLGSLPNDMAIDVRFTVDGYLSEIYRTPLLNPTAENTFNQLDTVMLVPDNNMGAGGAEGTISDSQGNLLAGVVLRFLSGINVLEGIVAATTVTNAQGLWTISGLEAGNYTCIIEIDGRDPIIENVQIVGGVENTNADIVVPQTSQVQTTQPQIDFPPQGSTNEYSPGEIQWDYEGLEYFATSGSYDVNQPDRIGFLGLRHFAGIDQHPLAYRGSSIGISHTFAGPGVYSVVGSRERLLEAAEADRPAALAFVRVVAFGPKGPVGAPRFEDYITAYEPPVVESANLSVSVDSSGRYVFEISGLELNMAPIEFLADDVHPNAPASIILNLSNGKAP